MKPTIDLRKQISQIDIAIKELEEEKNRVQALLNENIEQNKLETRSNLSKQIATILKENDGLEYDEGRRKFDYYDEDGRFVFSYNVADVIDEDMEEALSKVSDALSAYQIMKSHFDFNRFSISYVSDGRESYHVFSNRDNVNVRLKFIDSNKIDVTMTRSFGIDEYLHLRTYLTDTTSIVAKPSRDAIVEIEDNQIIDLISDLRDRFDQMIENVNQYRVSYEVQD